MAATATAAAAAVAAAASRLECLSAFAASSRTQGDENALYEDDGLACDETLCLETNISSNEPSGNSTAATSTPRIVTSPLTIDEAEETGQLHHHLNRLDEELDRYRELERLVQLLRDELLSSAKRFDGQVKATECVETEKGDNLSIDIKTSLALNKVVRRISVENMQLKLEMQDIVGRLTAENRLLKEELEAVRGLSAENSLLKMDMDRLRMDFADLKQSLLSHLPNIRNSETNINNSKAVVQLTHCTTTVVNSSSSVSRKQSPLVHRSAVAIFDRQNVGPRAENINSCGAAPEPSPLSEPPSNPFQSLFSDFRGSFANWVPPILEGTSLNTLKKVSDDSAKENVTNIHLEANSLFFN